MWYIIVALFSVTVGVIGMGIMSGRAYDKGYNDATHDMMIKEIVK